MNAAPLRTIKRGFFWIPGDYVDSPFGTVLHAPMFVEWEAPENVAQRYPVVLVHGGGGQGTDWKGTPDGRPGWVDYFVDAGYVTFIVDRPAHGRSWSHPSISGAPGAPFPAESAQDLFAPPISGHSQRPWADTPGDPTFDQLLASMGHLPADFVESQRMDGDRVARLLDRIGPAILIAHSAGAPAAWVAANLRPGTVAAIVAIEPAGPPFADIPGAGRLAWGLAATPLRTHPSTSDAGQLEAEPGAFTLEGYPGLPVVIVEADSSPFTGTGQQAVDFLTAVGGQAELMSLAEHGVTGNGHSVMVERNSADVVIPILRWLDPLDRPCCPTQCFPSVDERSRHGNQ